MGKDLTGKELGKGFSQRKDGRYQTCISLGEEENQYANMPAYMVKL
ncbi:hypothetical protein [Coprococcus comes]